MPWVVFTDPEVWQVGLTEEDARDRGGRIEVLRLPLDRIDRAQTTGDLDGFIKLITRNTILVGATIVAPVAGEIINELALAIRSRASLRDLSSTITPIRRTESECSSWRPAPPSPNSPGDGKPGSSVG